MANQLRQQIDQISREKNINPDVIIAAIEDAILTASKKYYKSNEDLRSRFNNETGVIEVFAVKQIVEEVEDEEVQIALSEARKLIPEAEVGQEIEFPKPTDILGRIAAQTAKQVIFQKVREAERDNVFSEYSGRVGEVINGIIKRQEMGDFVVDLGRAEALLPRKEQSRAETYQTGDRVRVAIVKVLKSAKGPQVVVSRTDPALLIKLFEMEVPEIYDGTVQIRGCVREAGERAKVAVVSREKDVDPVGACVGMKGTRVQSIIRELRGEKIDIVEWNDDATTFVINALSPAKVSRVSILDEEQRIMEVVVEDKQLSLAIGKKGQNVRLAAKLTGWKIDIKSEEEKRKEVEAQLAGIDFGDAAVESHALTLPDIHDEVVAVLMAGGFDTAEKVIDGDPEELAALPGFDADTVEAVKEAARAQLQAETQRAMEVAEAAEAAQADAGVAEGEEIADESADESAAGDVSAAAESDGAAGDDESVEKSKDE